MTYYTDEALERLLAETESDRVERKETFKGDAPTKAREAVCAFANDLGDHREPGVIFIGARDDGSPASLPITDELLRQLADMKTDGNILPPPTMTVETRTLRGVDIAVVTVWPADSPPVRFKGRTWIRVGSRRALASAQDERILNEKRRHRDQHFDAQPARGATLADLSRSRFEESYLPAAIDPEILAQNERSFEQRLAATKMIVSVEEPIPTVAGILVLGVRPRDFIPGAYVQFLRIGGLEWGDRVTDEAVLEGPVADLIRRVDDKLAAHNHTAVDFTSGPVETRVSTYPLAALQQLVRNAVLHRSYEGTNAPVRVYWFDDRIEIISPGGPFGLVTDENFGQPGVVDYRSPILAEAMRVLGLVQRFGFGIPTARRLLKEQGHPEPELAVDRNWVHWTVRKRVESTK
jgi:ATP-dependent DNA helicase RecG